MRGLLIFFLAVAFYPVYAQKNYEQDYKTGSAVATKIEKQIGLVHIPNAEATVKKVGERLVSQLLNNPYTFSFKIVDQSEPNAFALPGGFVYVSRGLIALLKNEDELACVLGHEIIHVTQRHSAKSQRKAILPTILAVPGVILGSTLGGDLGDKIAAPMLGAGKIFLASYSRKQESEADDLGINLAAKAGYQPLALSDILNRIERAVSAEYGQVPKFSLFSDHPMTPDRMKAIQSLGSTLTPTSPVNTSSSFDFLSSFNQVMYGPDPAKGILNENVFMHPSLKIYWEMPKGWKYYNESSSVGASNDDHQVIALTVAGLDRQIDTLIVNFVNRYYASTRKKPMVDTTLAMTGREGSEVILPGRENGKILFTLWFKKEGFTYVMLGTGPSGQREFFEHTAKGFRDLTESDFPFIQQRELFVAKGVSGETFEALARRTGNSLNQKLTELINDSASGSFKEGEAIKVVLSKPYTIDKPAQD